MITFRITAIDEFKRVYTNVSVHTELEFDIGCNCYLLKPKDAAQCEHINWVYQFWMRHLIEPMLEKMGTDAYAVWVCEMWTELPNGGWSYRHGNGL